MSFRLVDDPGDRPDFLRETIDLVARELEASRDRMLERVQSATDEELTAGNETDWSVGMIAFHLFVSERGMVGIALRLARGELPASTAQPRPAAGSTSRPLVLEAASKAARAVARFREEFPSAPDLAKTAPSPYYGEINCFGWLHASTFHYRAHLDALERGTRSAL